jgi:uncharacterized repeat protein (TIGR03803 family)
VKKFRLTKSMCLALAICAASAIAASAQTLTTLASFTGTNGKGPQSLVQGTDGNFYGVTYSGGANNNAGTVFKITSSGTLTTLYNFCSQTDCVDGAAPVGQLLQATDGNFYGTTYMGGSYCVSGNDSNTGCGTVFKITPEGVFTSLHSFCAEASFSCDDGSNPYAALIQGADGNLYGTTPYGGNNAADNNCFCSGFGTAFKITTAGALTTIFQFCNSTNSDGYCLDGGTPFGGLLQTADGSFYGTLYGGGTGIDNSGGLVYRLTSSGAFTALHDFGSERDWTDGAYPFDNLIRGKDGNFYGTTRNGGYGGTLGGGTAFKITPAGVLTTLHRFHGKQGQNPYTSLIQVADGTFYGINSVGGPYSDTGNASGTAFRMTTAGDESIVYAFCSLAGCADGYVPTGLVLGKDGNLYGTTSGGGASSDGTVFRIALKK